MAQAMYEQVEAGAGDVPPLLRVDAPVAAAMTYGPAAASLEAVLTLGRAYLTIDEFDVAVRAACATAAGNGWRPVTAVFNGYHGQTSAAFICRSTWHVVKGTTEGKGQRGARAKVWADAVRGGACPFVAQCQKATGRFRRSELAVVVANGEPIDGIEQHTIDPKPPPAAKGHFICTLLCTRHTCVAADHTSRGQGCSFSSEQVAAALRMEYEEAGRGWSMQQVLSRVRNRFDSGCSESFARCVRRRLASGRAVTLTLPAPSD